MNRRDFIKTTTVVLAGTALPVKAAQPRKPLGNLMVVSGIWLQMGAIWEHEIWGTARDFVRHFMEKYEADDWSEKRNPIRSEEQLFHPPFPYIPEPRFLQAQQPYSGRERYVQPIHSGVLEFPLKGDRTYQKRIVNGKLGYEFFYAFMFDLQNTPGRWLINHENLYNLVVEEITKGTMRLRFGD